MRAMKLSMSVAMVAVLVASEAHAQACTGVPTSDRQFALMGDLSLTEGVNGYGASASANLAGPWTVSGGYTLMSYEGPGPNGNGVDANAAYELKLSKLPRVSVCPTAGIGYGWVSEAGDKVSTTVIPVGIGFGKNLVDGSNFDMMVFGVPRFMHVRSHVESETLGVDETTSDNAFGGTLGGRVASSRFFGGASVSFSTLEGSDPVWGLTVGYVFGAKRQPATASRSNASRTKSSAKASPKSTTKSSAKPAAKSSTTRKK